MFPALGILSMVIVTFFAHTSSRIRTHRRCGDGPTRNGALGQPTRPISQTTTTVTLLAI